MDCVNHPGTTATAYCQNCGRALCGNCVRKGPAGQILCEQDFVAWQQVPPAFTAPPTATPNPALAAVLGLIPGVGAMYNGQFFKGLIHVVIFAVLVSIADRYGVFGIFIAAWIFYQSFEAYHTAVARREGRPLPDPLGLNEVGNWMNLSWSSRNPAQEWEKQQQAAAASQGANPNPASNPGASPGGNPGWSAGSNPGPYSHPAGTYPPPSGASYQSQYQQVPYAPVAGADPNVPPVTPPPYWCRREPIGAIILIGLGIIFLLNQFGYVTERIVHYSWPLVLIALGAWLILRRVGNTKGGQQ